MERDKASKDRKIEKAVEIQVGNQINIYLRVQNLRRQLLVKNFV